MRLLEKGGFSSAPWLRTAVFLLVILGMVAAIRLRLLDVPLERDEGEFAYAAQLLDQGLSPYAGAYTVMLKLPGTFVSYAGCMALFGQTPAGIHLGVMLINAATTVLVFLLGRRISGAGGGLAAAATFALLSIIPVTLGLAAHATHFVMLPAVAGILLIQKLDEQTPLRRIFAAGLLLGVAFWMKQTGALFGCFAAVWIWRCELGFGQRSWRRLGGRLACLAAGGALPILLTMLVIGLAGEFHRFWFWAFVYAWAHGSVLGWQAGLHVMFANLLQQFKAAPAWWSLALAGFIPLFFHPFWRPWRFFLGSLALCSFLAVCPGWYFRGHYFIQLLPVAGLLAGVTYRAAGDWLAKLKLPAGSASLPAIVFTVAVASSLVQWNDVFFRLTPVEVCRSIYGPNPFPEAVRVADYLKSHCAPDARIAVMGSEPEIFFYAHRRSATGHICVYPLVEQQPYAAAMRSEMIQEITAARPEYAVLVRVPPSWVQTSAPMDPSLLKWFHQYARDQFQLVELVEIWGDHPSDFRPITDPQAAVSTTTPFWLAIYRRN